MVVGVDLDYVGVWCVVVVVGLVVGWCFFGVVWVGVVVGVGVGGLIDWVVEVVVGLYG